MRTFPNSVVSPTISTAGELNAASMAIASSGRQINNALIENQMKQIKRQN